MTSDAWSLQSTHEILHMGGLIGGQQTFPTLICGINQRGRTLHFKEYITESSDYKF